MRSVVGSLVVLASAAAIAARCEAGGCSAPISVWNSRLGTPDGGGFDFSGTGYAGKPSPAPAIRFWSYGAFEKANSGTQGQHWAGMTWLLNAAVDAKVATASPNVFSLFQPNWMGGEVVGCAMDAAEPRTVVEISFSDPSKEGTTAHAGYYAIASVPYNGAVSSFDFDDVRGAGGKMGNIIPVVAIPTPRVVGAAEAATGGYAKLRIHLDPPVSYGEKGKDAPIALVKGFRILYAEGDEPTSSDPTRYVEARSPKDPAKALGMVKPGESTVAVPGGGRAWLVSQLVYADPSDLRSSATSAHVAASAAPPDGGERTRGRSREGDGRKR